MGGRRTGRVKAAAPLCVLGMHRSGTSLVTGVLRLWGLDLGPERRLMEPKPDNPMGFWEHLDLYAVNEELLSRLGGGWADPAGLTGGWVASPEIAPLRRRARALIRRDFGEGRAWAWKDPRTSLLLPFWTSVIPGMRFVICVRDPLGVAASLRERDGLAPEQSGRLWTLYTAAALFHTRGAERILVFPERMLERGGGELARLRRFARVPADRAAAARQQVGRFVDARRWHHRSRSGATRKDDALLPAARLLHAALLRHGKPRSGDLDPELDQFAELIWADLEAEETRARARREAEELRGRLEVASGELEASRQESLRLEGALRDALETAAEQRRRIEGLEQEEAAARAELTRSQARGAELEAELTASEARAARQADSLQRLEDEARRLSESRDAHRRSLEAVQSTLGWRGLERYRRARDRILAKSARLDGLHQALTAWLRRRLAPPRAPIPASAAPPPPPAAAAPDRGAPPAPVPPPAEWAENPDRPPVVIAIPHWNRVDYLTRCLESLFEHTRYPHHRVCVVDQASTDGSREYLEGLAGRVHVIRVDTNLGFLRGCNLAAATFPAWDVVFLNNDTRVTPGWLESLVATARASPRIGLVGARLVYPDGRLQEAGSQVFRDGSARAYGRLEPQGDLRYEQRREVDYCSAAALYVKREVLDACGGFEECYAPSYYEDADLAFKARAAGYATVYEPSSTVIHHEYGSSDPDAARARMEHNRSVFVERWRGALASHPESLWQAPSRGRRRVLYVGDIVPAPDRSSGGTRLYQLLRILAQHCDVSYAFLPAYGVDEYLRALERIGVHVFSPGYARAVGDDGLDLEAILAHNRFAVVVCSLHTVASRLVPLIRRASPDSAIAVDSYDVHFLREEREARLADDPRLLESARQTRRAELAVYAAADRVVTVTASDRSALLAARPDLDVCVIPNIHPIPDRIAPRAGRRDLLFVGGFSHRPNVDAVLFFCREVLPIVRGQRPDLTLHVVGNAPPAEVLALRGDGVEVHGYVADLRYFLDHSLVSVAPLRYGSGMKGKVGEAMAHGLPVATTPIGAEGMDLRSGHDALIADDAQGLARDILRLCDDDRLWERIAAGGLARVRSEWTPEAVTPGLLELVGRPRAS